MPSNTYLWLGCEDVDFPYPSAYGSTITVDTSAAHFRANYQRSALTTNTLGYFRGTTFPGGAVTSCWLHFYMLTNSGITANSLCLGLVNDSTANSGLWLGVLAPAASQRLVIYTFDGTTKTALATDAVATLGSSLTQVDIQLVNYGASAFVQVYLNQVPTLSFSGDTRIAGLTNLNAVCLGSSNVSAFISEIVVATGDTRYLPAMANITPNAAGTTAGWLSGLFSDVNPVTMSASLTYAYTNTASQDQQFNMSDLTTFGTYAIGGVKAIATAARSGGATPTNLKVGFNIGGTVNVGSSVAVGAGLTPVERYSAVNPVSGVDWTPANINSLQVDLQSA